MGGGMMRKDTMMKKGGKIPPQLKKKTIKDLD